MRLPEFVQTGLTGLKTTYALVDPGGYIVEHGPLFPLWILGEQTDLVGSPLLDILPEFIGQEEALTSVLLKEKPFFRLEHINRSSPAGKTRYLTLIVVPGQPEVNLALTVFVTDVTQQGEYVQELTQNRNELRLARQRMAKLSFQLDYLLRHYLAPEVADALLKGELDPGLGGELRQVSILFADIRDFTPLAERLSPERIVQLLNDHLHIAAEAIDAHEGSISQFQGDNLMAIFNMFGDQSDHAQQAVRAGITLQQAVNRHRNIQPSGEPRLHFGVGINSGPALIGNVGAQRRYSYTAIGDTVNLAARITGVAPANEVWISGTTHEQLGDSIPVETLPPLTFKGKSQSTSLYKVPFRQNQTS